MNIKKKTNIIVVIKNKANKQKQLQTLVFMNMI